jgi:hypothetical protein
MKTNASPEPATPPATPPRPEIPPPPDEPSPPATPYDLRKTAGIWRATDSISGVRLQGEGRANRLPAANDFANTVLGKEADTIIANDGRILNGRDGYDKDGLPQNV